MFAFARGTHDRGRCFPAFPRRDEMPCPCSASLTRYSPALCCPWENQRSAGTRWGIAGTGGAVPARGAAPHPRAAPADSSGCGSSVRELRGKWNADVAGTGGNCSSLWGSETILGTVGGQAGSPLLPRPLQPHPCTVRVQKAAWRVLIEQER